MSEIKMVDIDQIHASAIQRDTLPEIFYNEALSIYNLISEVEGGSFEKFEENFRRDANFEKEMAIWRCIANAYNNFVTARIIISLPEKKDAFHIALYSSMSYRDEDQVKAKENISEEDAKFIYRSYRSMIEQTFKNRRNRI